MAAAIPPIQAGEENAPPERIARRNATSKHFFITVSKAEEIAANVNPRVVFLNDIKAAFQDDEEAELGSFCITLEPYDVLPIPAVDEEYLSNYDAQDNMNLPNKQCSTCSNEEAMGYHVRIYFHCRRSREFNLGSAPICEYHSEVIKVEAPTYHSEESYEQCIPNISPCTSSGIGSDFPVLKNTKRDTSGQTKAESVVDAVKVEDLPLPLAIQEPSTSRVGRFSGVVERSEASILQSILNRSPYASSEKKIHGIHITYCK